MATFYGNGYGSGVPISASGRDDTVVVNSYYTHPTASTKLTDGDLVFLAKIPSGHIVTGLQLFCGDLDAATALVFDVGLMDTTDTALETVFISGSTLGRAGGTLAIPVTTTMFTTAAATVDKVLAVEVTTSAGTKGSADAVIGCVVTYAAI